MEFIPYQLQPMIKAMKNVDATQDNNYLLIENILDIRIDTVDKGSILLIDRINKIEKENQDLRYEISKIKNVLGEMEGLKNCNLMKNK
ncbi:MAG: hypothetical protein HQK51_19910 [Oligoflexia bacterium]|nr:hypothetical protein [Oligoflexia bacterium]